MRLVSYEKKGSPAVGIRGDGGVASTGYDDMIDLIRAGEQGLTQAAETAERAELMKEYRLLPPLQSPGKILCSGINYPSHLEENPSATLPTSPQIFAKLPSAVIGPDESIVLPRASDQVDYEVELAAVIGRRARGVDWGEALEYVFGYTVLNDVSARDVQFADNQITTSKGYDTFCPIGPEVVLRDEIPNPSGLHVSSYVNGERMQSSPTADMIFDLGTLIEFLSAHITLYPGDVVSTGTPAGVGVFREPPVFLKHGDVVDVEVDGIGCLTNPVVAE